MEEYHDGDFEYGVVESLIEEIIDKYDLKAHFYLESDKFDNTISITMIPESVELPEDYNMADEIKVNALINLVADLLNERMEDERNAVISLIYESVYAGIHYDDEEEEEDEEESDYE